MTDSVLRQEIAREQRYIDRLYGVLDRARDRATVELARVHGGPTTGTDQAATERDSFAQTYAGRADQLLAVERGLCFGRLDHVDL
ncbi:MAG: helicase, partial [Propionibacteriaceae bacterium]